MPEKDWVQPWALESGTMATDMTTRSALQRAKAKPSMATTLTLSEVRNSKKLAFRGPLSSENSPEAPFLVETLAGGAVSLRTAGATRRGGIPHERRDRRPSEDWAEGDGNPGVAPLRMVPSRADETKGGHDKSRPVERPRIIEAIMEWKRTIPSGRGPVD